MGHKVYTQSKFVLFSDILPSSTSPVITNGADDDDDFNPRAEESSPPTTNGLNGSASTDSDDDDDFDPRAEEKKPPSFSVGPTPEINGFSSPPPLGETWMSLSL